MAQTWETILVNLMGGKRDIGKDELKEALKKRDYEPTDGYEDWFDQLCTEPEDSADRRLTVEDLLTKYTETALPKNGMDCIFYCMMHDTDGSGIITKEEIKARIEAFQKADLGYTLGVSEERLGQVVFLLDENCDGEITCKEFVKVWTEMCAWC